MPLKRGYPHPNGIALFMALTLATILSCVAHEYSSKKSIFQIARPTADHSSLEVVEDGIRRLEAMDPSQPISIVGVVGGFHTGKSFLCNVLNGTTSGFELGPTHEATTMGLWLGDTNMVSSVDGSRVLLLDTEGFSAAGVAEAYDAQIFSVALLLSSHLVYNSVKLITAAEVEYLEILARRAHLWSLQTDFRGLSDDLGEEGATVPSAGRAVIGAAASFPPLTWVVEDFFQDLGDTTPTEWLMSFIDEDAAAASTTTTTAKAAAAAATTTATSGGAAESSSLSSSSGANSGGAGGASQMSDRPKHTHGATRPGRRPLVDGNYTISRLFGGGSGGAEDKAKRGAKGAVGSRIKAHTLFLPASSRMALRSLNTVPFGELDAEFLAQVSSLRRDLLAATSAKSAGAGAASKAGEGGAGSRRSSSHSATTASAHSSAPVAAPALTGRGLAALLRVLVASVSAGHFPSLPSLWSSWEGQLLSQARAAAIELHAAAAEKALLGGGASDDDHLPPAAASPAATSDGDASLIAADLASPGSSASPRRRPPLPPDEFAARMTAARREAEDLFRDSLFGLEQLWRGPLADLRRELTAREAKDTELNAAAVDRELTDAAEEVGTSVQGESAESTPQKRIRSRDNLSLITTHSLTHSLAHHSRTFVPGRRQPLMLRRRLKTCRYRCPPRSSREPPGRMPLPQPPFCRAGSHATPPPPRRVTPEPCGGSEPPAPPPSPLPSSPRRRKKRTFSQPPSGPLSADTT